jgi:hypothetical protein
MDIKYFSLSEWVERDLMLLERIGTSINLADHFTKCLLPALFHQHADFILGHIPPAYSPIYRSIIGSYVGIDDYIEKFVPSSFTTSLLPLQHEYMLLYSLTMQTIPGFTFLGMGSTIHMFLCQYTVNCGGVLP